MLPKHNTPAWFGSWPPIVRKDVMPNKVRNFIPLGGTDVGLVVVLLIGLILIGLADRFESHHLLRSLLEGLGIALVTAFIIAEIVDKFLKRQLVANAVQAALGYMLPPELKEEMQWIYEQHFIAMEHEQIYDLRMNPDGVTVTVHCEATRRLINFTDTAQDIKVGLAVDEWGFEDRRSQILYVTYRLEGGEWNTIPQEVIIPKDGALSVEPRPCVSVPKGGAIEVQFAFEEIRRSNDVTDQVFTYPTRHPRVIVKADDALYAEAKFGHRKQAQIIPNRVTGSYQLVGTLLPEQHIVVRWWPKENATRDKNDGDS